jgi:tetratricopeptide (TPR) repeat protein
MLLNNLAAVAMDQGDFERADRYQEESLALKRRGGDRAGVATSLHNLADTARYRGRYERAAALSEESLAIFRGLDLKPQLAQALHTAGIVAGRLGDRARAMALLTESLTLFYKLDIQWGIPLCLEALAELAIARGDDRAAARLLGAARVLREEIGAPLSPVDRADVDAMVTRLRQRLAPEVLAATWEAGGLLTREQVVEAARATARNT